MPEVLALASKPSGSSAAERGSAIRHFPRRNLPRLPLLEIPLPAAYSAPVMWGILRRVVVLLSVLAFLSGMTIQAIPSAEALGLIKVGGIAMAGPECPRMAMQHPDRGVPKPLPCKGIMPDCVKQMGCLGSPNLPERSAAFYVPVSFRMVAYWPPCPVPSSQDVEPDLFPPIEG